MEKKMISNRLVMVSWNQYFVPF